MRHPASRRERQFRVTLRCPGEPRSLGRDRWCGSMAGAVACAARWIADGYDGRPGVAQPHADIANLESWPSRFYRVEPGTLGVVVTELDALERPASAAVERVAEQAQERTRRIHNGQIEAGEQHERAHRERMRRTLKVVR